MSRHTTETSALKKMLSRQLTSFSLPACCLSWIWVILSWQ